MSFTTSKGLFQANPPNISPNKNWPPDVVRLVGFVRSYGTEFGPLRECDYPKKLPMPDLEFGYAISFPPRGRGRLGVKRIMCMDDFYPILEVACGELGRLLKKDPRQDKTIARQHGLDPLTVRLARYHPKEAVPALIQELRGIQVSTETLDKQRQAYRLCNPLIRSLADLKAHLKNAILEYLTLQQ